MTAGAPGLSNIPKHNMNRQTRAISNDMIQLAQDASALMAATADVAGVQVTEARKHLAEALDRGKELYGRVRDKEEEGVNAVDMAMHEHPAQAIALGVACIALLGYLLSRRCACNGR